MTRDRKSLAFMEISTQDKQISRFRVCGSRSGECRTRETQESDRDETESRRVASSVTQLIKSACFLSDLMSFNAEEKPIVCLSSNMHITINLAVSLILETSWLRWALE